MDTAPRTTTPNPFDQPPTEKTSTGAVIDPLMEQRLARLAARRPAGSTLASATSSAAPAPTGRTATPPTGRTRRRHAARGSRTAAVLMSIGTTVGLTACFEHLDSAAAANTTASTTASSNTATSTAAASTAATASTSAATTRATTAATVTTAKATTATAAGATGTTYADGTYTGATETNKWGPVQVQVTVSGGKITSVTALQTPDSENKSVQINDRAVPTLNAEVVTAQTAKINSVSGATYTSTSYKQSLQSALDQALAASATAG